MMKTLTIAKKKRSSIPKTGEINPDEPCIASRPWNF